MKHERNENKSLKEFKMQKTKPWNDYKGIKYVRLL